MALKTSTARDLCGAARVPKEMAAPVPESTLLIAFDIGSSSVRCAILACQRNTGAYLAEGAPSGVGTSNYVAHFRDTDPALTAEVSKTDRTLSSPGSAECHILPPEHGSTTLLARSKRIIDHTYDDSHLASSFPRSRRPASYNECGTFSPEYVLELCKAALSECIEELCETPPPIPQLEALTIAITSFGGNMLLVDRESGDPLSELFTYANRGEEADVAMTKLSRKLSSFGFTAAHVHDATGAPLHPAYGMCMMQTLQDRDEACLHDGRGVLTTIGALLVSQIALVKIAAVPLSLSEISWLGLRDMQTDSLPEALLGHLFGSKAAACFGVLPSTSPQRYRLQPGSVSTALQSLPPCWKQRETAPLLYVPAVIDGAAATLWSHYRVAPGIAVTIGTSSAARCLVTETVLKRALCQCATPDLGTNRMDPCAQCTRFRLSSLGLWCYALSPCLLLVGGAQNDGGSLMEMLENLLGCDASVIPTDVLLPGRVLCLPAFGGERATGWRTNVRGGFLQVDPSAAPTDFIVAAMEGISFRLRHFIECIHSIDNSQSLVALSGGAVEHFRLWNRIFSNIVPLPCVKGMPSILEATLQGCCLHALCCVWNIHMEDLRPDIVGTPAVAFVDGGLRAKYEGMYGKFTTIYDTVMNALEAV